MMDARTAVEKIRGIVAPSDLEDDDEKLRQVRAVVFESIGRGALPDFPESAYPAGAVALD